MLSGAVWNPLCREWVEPALLRVMAWSGWEVLAAHQQFPLAQRGLHGLSLGYGVVLIYHFVLCVRLV